MFVCLDTQDDIDVEKIHNNINESYQFTVQQLCTHTAGIRHYKNISERHSIKNYETIESSLEIFKNDDLISVPGIEFNYTTYGYVILSLIIEKYCPEKNYLQFMKNHIFNPLNMNHTFAEHTIFDKIFDNFNEYLDIIRIDDVLNDNTINAHENNHLYTTKQYVQVYIDNDDDDDNDDNERKLALAPFVNNSNKVGSGGFVSSAGDLATFGYNVVIGDFLDQKFKNILLKKYKNATNKYDIENKNKNKNKKPYYKMNKDKIMYYGFGFEISHNTENGDLEIMHSGRAIGGTSYLLVLPQFDISIAVLINTDNTDPYLIATNIAKMFKHL